MKKLLLLTKTLLVAALLCVGQNAWGETETLTGTDSPTKNTDFSKTSFTVLGDYWPDKSNQTINSKACLKVRWNKTVASTGNEEGFALKVKPGYKITGLTAQMSGNSNSLTLSDIKIDGVAYSGSYTKTIPAHNASPGDTYNTITLTGIEAMNYINFVKGSGDATQGYVYITVTYEKYTQIWNDDCSTKTAWKTHGTASEAINVTTNNALVADNSYVNFKTDNGKDRSNYYSLSSADNLFANASDYMFEFDLAIYGSNSTNHLAHANLLASGTTVFSIDCTSGNTFQLNAGTAITAHGIDVTSNNSSTRDNIGAATVWYHYTVISNATAGTLLTVEKWVNGAKTSAVATTKIANGLLNLTELQLNGGSYQQWSIDNLTLSVNLEPYKNRASSAVSAYTAVKDKVMNSTVKSVLDGAKTALDAFADDAAIAANISGYISAISALETANGNAVTSADNFEILNELIGNSKPAGYVAPSGAETVYTSNADVDPVALASSVRAAIITAGTANENTDISGLIINNSFELGTTYGWTTTASDDTGARRNDNATYTTTGTDGDYLFNTWSQGTPIKQNIGTLPAGRYKLSCLVASNGGTIYLTMNDSHEGHRTTGDGSNFEEAEYTFALGSDTEVTIGAVGGDGDGNYTAEGHWWYKADQFTLTYVGEDPVAVAKASLEAEIETANTLKDSWTPKVGTAPFKYDATYYNALGTQITSATSVLNSGSETVSDYTTAESALETAESNMASSTQNAPDPDKYYQIFVANNDGTASDYNLYMLYERTKTQVKVSATPYPIKIVVDTDNSSYYNIQTPYGNSLCTDKSAKTTAYVTSAEGIEKRCNQIKFTLNDNGTIVLGGNAGSGSFNNYQASTSEGSSVTAPQGGSGKWVISDAVEVTDVNLAVNATTGWGTFIAPYDNLTPSTVKAYTVSHKDGNIVYFEENETGVLSANTPYILSTEEPSNVAVAFKGIANNDEVTYSANGLVGLLAAETVPANSYILQYQAEKVGTAFYKLASDMTGTVNRCYLDLSAVPVELSARATVRMSIFGGITGVENVEASAEAALKDGKYLEKGNVVIVKNGQKYNATGAKLY